MAIPDTTGLLEVFRAYPWFLYLNVAALSLIVGSFLNVLIHRLPRMIVQADADETVEQGDPGHDAPVRRIGIGGRSACPACGTTIPWRHNVPVLAWLWLKGRCHSCRASISGRYPLVELLALAAGLACVALLGPQAKALAAALLLWALIALFFIDLETGYLPDAITLPLLWAGLLVNLALAGPGLAQGQAFVRIDDAILGAVVGYMAPWCLNAAYRYARGHDGFGGGDMKMFAMLGAWMGLHLLVPLTIFACVLGAAGGIVHFMLRRESAPYPFGPYIAVSAASCLFLGDWVGPLMGLGPL